MEKGKNVDILLENPYFWDNLQSESYDVVISGQTFEHIEFFWITILQINRILKKNGIACIIAPAGGFEHKYPVDCWRYFPDGLKALAKWSKMDVLESHTQWEKENYQNDDSDLWMDSVLVCKKTESNKEIDQIIQSLNNWILKQKVESKTSDDFILKPSSLQHNAILTLLSIYQERKDLQEIYPEARNGVNLSNLICWAKNYGVKEDSRIKPHSDFYEKNCQQNIPNFQNFQNHYLNWFHKNCVFNNNRLGQPAIKTPFDAWVYQEIIFETKPDVIIEIGNHSGGSTLFLATLLDELKHGKIIGIDIDHSKVKDFEHPRISWITGNATDEKIFQQTKAQIQPKDKVMIIEDSSHTFENTLSVLNKYSELVSLGCYFVVEDSILKEDYISGPKPGPYEAIHKFLKQNKNFEIDKKKEKFLFTYNIDGFLLRVK